MDISKLQIIMMPQRLAHEISKWRYDGLYSFYDHRESNEDDLLDGTHYACVDAEENIIGFFCFGDDARIPTVENDVCESGFLDFGLGLRPDLCGKGLGVHFVQLGLNYAQKSLKAKKIRLWVAAFNERAIKVYLRVGFCINKEVTNSFFQNKFYIMTRLGHTCDNEIA